MVVRGVPKLPLRRTFKLWEEGEAPCLVVEMRKEVARLRREVERLSKR
jgi:hypothetical protein